MTLKLDDNQTNLVETKKKSLAERPEYFNSSTGKQTTISEDFEAFLILQGRDRNADTTKWLEQCVEFGNRDVDRDALVAVTLKNEIEDAEASTRELQPFIKLFQKFKDGFDLVGFENVTECGALLDDIQKAMLEIQNLTARLRHRTTYGKVALSNLRNNGVTVKDEQQLNSWFSPLSAY